MLTMPYRGKAFPVYVYIGPLFDGLAMFLYHLRMMGDVPETIHQGSKK